MTLEVYTHFRLKPVSSYCTYRGPGNFDVKSSGNARHQKFHFRSLRLPGTAWTERAETEVSKERGFGTFDIKISWSPVLLYCAHSELYMFPSCCSGARSSMFPFVAVLLSGGSEDCHAKVTDLVFLAFLVTRLISMRKAGMDIRRPQMRNM